MIPTEITIPFVTFYFGIFVGMVLMQKIAKDIFR